MPSLQLTLSGGLHVPPPQNPSAWKTRAVQPWSTHLTVLFVTTQPDAGLHELSVHTLVSVQTFGVPEVHVPPAQMSFSVHALLSLHPLVLGALTHPVSGSQ
jgi:hypothetical protein